MVHNPTKSLIWPFSEKVLRLFLGTALTLMVTQQIGPADFGVFSTVFAIFMLFSAAVGLGLKDIIIDEISSERVEPHTVVSTAAVPIFAAGLVFSTIFITLIALVYGAFGTEFWIALILSFILLMKGYETFLFGLESHALLRPLALSQHTFIITGTIGKVVILFLGATTISFSAVTALEFVFLFVAATILASRHDFAISMRAFQIAYAMLLLKRSWPLVVSSLSVIGYFYVDQIIISLLMDSEAVGIYAAASRISQQFYMLPTVLIAAYYPRLTQIHTQSFDVFNNGFKNLSAVLITLSICLWGLVIMFGEVFLGLFLDNRFDQTASILTVHTLGLICVSLNMISGRWYVMKGFQKLTLVRQLLTAALNVVLNFLLIPIFGLNGAVYATLLSLLFLALGFDLIGVKTRHLAKMKLSAFAILIRPKQTLRAFRELASL